MKKMPSQCKNFSFYGLTSLATTVLISAIALSANLVKASDRATAAFFAGGGVTHGLVHRSGRGRSSDQPVQKDKKLNPGHKLIVNTNKAWTRLGYVIGGSNDYEGLILQTMPGNAGATYTFPCSTNGQFMIAWRSARGRRSCRTGFKLASNNYGQAIASKGSSNALKKIFSGTALKQALEDESVEHQLNIQPGDEQVVLRRKLVNSGSKWVCEREESQDGNSFFERCWTVPTKSTVVDVLLGDISVQSDESPGGKTVRQGERFTYPGGNIVSIDAASEANTCEVQKFLNPYYWTVPPSIPNSVLEEMKAQLAEHREAIGIFGGDADLSTLEQGVVAEMNYARTTPTAYAKLLQERRQYYRGNRLELPGEIPIVDLREGVVAVDDAIRDLQAISRPLEPLGASDGLSRAAQDLVNKQSRSGAVGHGDWQSRIDRYGESGCIPRTTENVSYGSDTARNVVMQLIIDDGSTDRGHRQAILNPDLQVTGVACGSHPQYRSMCAITYAGGYKEGS
ncbi:MAG: CAP domain-containing protein [Bacteroidia bacterium]